MLEEWEINKTDLVSITTDNAANMTKAFEEFPDVWLGCFCHNLNLAISKALKIQRVETAVRTCRHLVQGFSRSWKRKRGLREKQAALTLPPLALIHDVVTRWGSTYKMLERFISQQQAVCATLAAERGALHLMPKDTDIIVMEQVCQLLEPLSKFTDALCSETRVTLSAIKPVLDHITGDVLEENEEEPALTKQMKQAMREDLNNQYTEKAKYVMQMACFIDPRFKNNFLDAPVDDVVDRCVQEALKLTPVQVRQEPQSTSSNSTAAAGGKGLAGLLKKITSTRQQRSEEGSGSATPEDKVKEEVKVYMSLPSIPADDDPLVWWRGHASELPHLARLAKKLLCIPATSVPSERIFSASGHILSSLRSHLKPEKRGAVGQTARQRSTATGSSVTQTLEQAFQKQTDYVPASQKAQELTAAITYLIAKDMMPFRTVERPGFLRMMKVAVPHYKVPTRNYFSKTEIPKMYNAVKADVKKSLAQGEFFAATTDFWTSERGGGLPYISFTVHYLTPDWQLESHCLETQFFPEVHSAQNIAVF
nr:E3 SUMO-protein ligase ZBED1-like [Nothobranchius furzeri]